MNQFLDLAKSSPKQSGTLSDHVVLVIMVVYKYSFLLQYYYCLSRVETIDGTATVDQDYVPINEIITFEPGETEKFVSNYKGVCQAFA